MLKIRTNKEELQVRALQFLLSSDWRDLETLIGGILFVKIQQHMQLQQWLLHFFFVHKQNCNSFRFEVF